MLNSFNKPMILILKMPIVFDLLYFQEKRREGGGLCSSWGAWRTQPFLLVPAVAPGCQLALLCLPPVPAVTPTLPGPGTSAASARRHGEHDASLRTRTALAGDRRKTFPASGLRESVVGVNVLSNHSPSPFIPALSEPCWSSRGKRLPFLSKRSHGQNLQTCVKPQFIPSMREFILH